MRQVYGWLLLVFLVACAPAAAPDAKVVEPIQIDQVEVRVAESFPPQVFVHVTGVVGDGCAELLPVEQRRDGRTITLTINRQRPTEAVCIQLAKLYDENLALGGDFQAGDYTLKVNDVTQTFHID
jgi:hypothetical protein